MRTRTETPTQIQAASLIPSVVEDGVINSSIVEIRGTLKVAPGNNQRQFFFHGGCVTLRKEKEIYFGEVRPFPWLKNKEGWVLNKDGSHKTGAVWCQKVKRNSINLSEQDKMMLAVLQAKPEMVEQFKAVGGITPNVLQALEGNSLTYGEFDFEKYVKHIFNHNAVKLTFTIPQQFINAVKGIKHLVENKEKDQAYSFVLRFDAKRLNAAKELSDEYDSEEKRQDVPIYPTYIGFIEGATYEDDESKYIAPEITDEAWDIATAPKKVNYISRETLAARAEVINARINKTGTGKKDHKEVVDDLFAAAESQNWNDFETHLAVLRGIEKRGTNKFVPQGYSEKVSEAARSKAPESTESVMTATKTVENTEPTSTVASESELDAFFGA